MLTHRVEGHLLGSCLVMRYQVMGELEPTVLLDGGCWTFCKAGSRYGGEWKESNGYAKID